jgi:adenylate cyclase
MQFESNKDEIESKQFKHTIWFCSVLLTGFLVLSINQIHSSYPLENANIVEFYLILGLLTSVIICFLIVRVQIPEVTRSEIKKLLNIALPRQVASSFLSNPKLMHETIEMPATIIFCDLNNFTSVVEELDGNHEKLQSYLQESLGIICEEHSKQNLIIDKFMGDCVMSFKGGNLVNGTPAEHALSVVKATLNSKSVLNKSKLSYFNDVQIGGASTDSALIGAFGTEKRLSYTVLGDAVNLASRLESASKKCGVSNLFCEKTKRLTDGNKYFIWREVGYLLVTGKKQVVKAFEALEKNKVNQNLIDSFHHALNEYKLKNFEKAKNLFEKTINLVSSSDKLSEKYLQNCNSLLKNGVPIDWEPTIVVSK